MSLRRMPCIMDRLRMPEQQTASLHILHYERYPASLNIGAIWFWRGFAGYITGGECRMDRVRAQLFANEAHWRGLTGRGVTAAVLDSGCSLHPDLDGRIVAFADFLNGRKTCYDDASHGTHISGILAGNGKSSGGRYCGIAPDCALVVAKVLDRHGEGDIPVLVQAIDWILENRNRYGVRILNISVGVTREENAARLLDKVEEAWDAGLVVVAAAGNMGPRPGTVTAPGTSRKVITVGSSDLSRRRDGNGNPDYSGCGPTTECICKPEFVAPGTNVVSCSPGWTRGHFYSVKSGTSMAAPAVAGCAALLLQKEPWLGNVRVKMRLRECARDSGLPKNRQGWGMPDLRRLLL